MQGNAQRRWKQTFRHAIGKSGSSKYISTADTPNQRIHPIQDVSVVGAFGCYRSKRKDRPVSTQNREGALEPGRLVLQCYASN